MNIEYDISQFKRYLKSHSFKINSFIKTKLLDARSFNDGYMYLNLGFTCKDSNDNKHYHMYLFERIKGFDIPVEIQTDTSFIEIMKKEDLKNEIQKVMEAYVKVFIDYLNTLRNIEAYTDWNIIVDNNLIYVIINVKEIKQGISLF